MFGKRGVSVVVLRDADVIAEALRDALSSAGEAERPGLERAAALVAEASRTTEAELRGRWTRQRLTDAGHEGPVDSVAAIKALRQAEPGLSLLAAVQLTKEAAA
ncbi:hypothetical protein GCM10009837_69930 [Streptomyces durmitorensis]|uniref:Uncharacterized protein n=1 Tax=Streptomyces durmitorensis TaxID=319947 RepID=A0ABY4Q777_9ACTN|nr:hypothetical protein [Streptomyces durmitorensis]UQT61571.1 hypothetical protein M4V62_17730 [Streptomyces durmitorensis]